MIQEYSCRNHPDRKALSFCHYCHAYYCFDCLKEGPEYYYCKRPQCLKAFEDESKPQNADETSHDSPETLPEELIPIASFFNPMEANVAKSKLESEGIECFLFDEHALQHGVPLIAAGGVRLMVRESEAQEASRILENPAD